MDWSKQVRNDHSHQTSTEAYKPEFLAVNKRLTGFCHRSAIWITRKYFHEHNCKSNPLSAKKIHIGGR